MSVDRVLFKGASIHAMPFSADELHKRTAAEFWEIERNLDQYGPGAASVVRRVIQKAKVLVYPPWRLWWRYVFDVHAADIERWQPLARLGYVRSAGGRTMARRTTTRPKFA
jgi:hypothetical protein